MNKAIVAAQMREDGGSIAEIAAAMGWSKKTTMEMISRGKKIDEWMRKHREYQRRRKAEA